MNAPATEFRAGMTDRAREALAGLSHRAIARVAMAKIRPQFLMPDGTMSPEARLMAAVLDQALIDLADDSESIRSSALRYIRDDLACCEICGVDAEWVRDVLRKLGLID